MPNQEVGSTWKKWDLHVHTPDSIVHNYPGEHDAAWESFLTDLEALPPEFKVIGINDYVFVEGYRRVLKAKREDGRLANIDLILPVVELRLDKFGGVVKKGADGNEKSSWSRINLHVVFDQVDPDFIRDQFLSAITPNYSLIPGAEAGQGRWGGVINRQNLTALGQAIIDSVPEPERKHYGSPLTEGFNNLNISFDALRKALQNPMLAGKHLVAIGKTEWDNLKWDDHTIAEKKTLINEANLVFTAAENPAAYERGRKKLVDAGVNAALLDCSDAHQLSNSGLKDRIGNCFTWIKADATFSGLVHALNEFEARVYVGDAPPKLLHIAKNRTKFASAIRVGKKLGSTLTEPWFNVDIPLNSDLVAIIGNKGSGKSALSDIIALAGDTKNHASFSFLHASRFRNPRTKLAQHFAGTLLWRDGTTSQRDLDRDPPLSSVERVKYLPQSYLETLCNELGEGGSATFDTELRKIIYSHVPEEDQLGQPSMDALLDFKVAEINKARESVSRELSKVNAEILLTQKRLTPEFKKALEEQLNAKKAELAALDGAKPQEVDDPQASAAAQEESKQAAEQVAKLELLSQAIANEESALRDRKALAAKKLAVGKRVIQSISNYRKQHNEFLQELDALLGELDAGIKAQAIMDLRVDTGTVEAVIAGATAEVADIDNKLQSTDGGSLLKRREEAAASIATTKGRLDEKQRLFIRFKEALAQWQRAKEDVLGSREKINSVTWIQAEIDGLTALPQRLSELRKSRIKLAKAIHIHIVSAVNEYQRLYEPVQAFVRSAEQMDMPLPLDFEVKIDESGFQEQFLNRLNRQARGSFSGIDESGLLVRNSLKEAGFESADDAIIFAEKIEDMLSYDRRDAQGTETRLSDQLRKGVEPQEILDYLYGLAYLAPRYSLTYDKQEISQLSPGERGLLLLVFYLLVDKDDIPIVIDQPEENLDNQTIFKVLVKCIKAAKERRQVIMVTHNPNLAVVCDAEQIIHAHCDKSGSLFSYESGGIEHPDIRGKVVEILEGTEPAFKNRQSKYRLL
jgi:ABC-type lipoprotein export system ATPase subunit